MDRPILCDRSLILPLVLPATTSLALSEQIRALAAAEHTRLDSLFLDEGFGTLDRESLEVVIEAIEQLGGDGRVAGVARLDSVG